MVEAEQLLLMMFILQNVALYGKKQLFCYLTRYIMFFFPLRSQMQDSLLVSFLNGRVSTYNFDYNII